MIYSVFQFRLKGTIIIREKVVFFVSFYSLQHLNNVKTYKKFSGQAKKLQPN